MYDLIIIGNGVAGLSASIYASRYLLNFILIGKEIGGVVTVADKIENYPGFLGISGIELIEKFKKHAESLGTKIIKEEVRSIKKTKNDFLIITAKNEYKTKTILLTIGTERRKLEIPGEKELTGKGISFCATCDGFFYRNKIVGVVGGSDAACTVALTIANIAKKVYLIYRKDKLRAEPIWTERIIKNKKIEIIYNTNIVKALGKSKLEAVILDKKYKNSEELKLDGLFIEVGSVPNLALIKDLNIKTDEKGYVMIDKASRTSIEGVWAAGDITNGSNDFRQIITAASEAAIAVNDIYKYLRKKEK